MNNPDIGSNVTRFPGLTQDKLVLLSSIAQGIDLDEIAENLHVERRTLYQWLRDMKLYSGATNMAHLIAISIRSRIISAGGKILINLGPNEKPERRSRLS